MLALTTSYAVLINRLITHPFGVSSKPNVNALPAAIPLRLCVTPSLDQYTLGPVDDRAIEYLHRLDSICTVNLKTSFLVLAATNDNCVCPTSNNLAVAAPIKKAWSR